MLRLITGLILLLCAGNTWAQLDQKQVELDSLTYAQYLNKDWKQLLHTANKAIDEKEDFYLVNIRAAIASASLNKPYKEQYYLQRSYQDFPNDPKLTLPMLYVNYLSTGQYPQALRISKQMEHDSTLKQYFPKRPAIHLVGAEVGFKQSTDSALYKPLLYAQAGLGFRVKTVSLYNAFSWLKQEAYYGTMQQYQYYISAMIPFSNNWTLAPAFHVLHYSIQNTLAVADSSQLSGTPYVAGMNATKLYRNFQYGLGVYYSTLNYETQLQLQPAITWFPFSNNMVSLNVTGNYLTEKNTLATSATASLTPNRYLTFSGSYLSANTRYYTEQNGFLVNNSYDITGDRIMGMVNYNATLNWSIYAVYLHETKQLETIVQTASYAYDMLVLGLKRTF
jgi:hypothetical protein